MEEDNVALARRIVEEGFGQNRPEIFDELTAENFVEHQKGMSVTKDGPKSAIRYLHKAFPDLTYKLVNAIAKDDLVCLHYTVSGTHKGDLGPMAPSGKRFEIYLIDIMRFRNGKLLEHWGVPDRLGMMEDLGFWPPKPVQ